MHGFDAHETPYVNYEIYGPCNKDSNPKAINANIPKSENVINSRKSFSKQKFEIN